MTIRNFESFIQRVYEATGISSQMELASSLQIHRSAITQARRKDSIPDKWILQLYKIYGLNPEWLETGLGPTFLREEANEDEEFVTIPKVKARLCAGGGSFETAVEIEEFYSFRRDWLRSKGTADEMVLMDVVGNSMEPELKDGDTVLINESQKNILAGAVYAVGVDDTIMVKRLEKLPNKLVLLSDNKNYDPIFLEGEEINSVAVIGKVIWVCREYR